MNEWMNEWMDILGVIWVLLFQSLCKTESLFTHHAVLFIVCWILTTHERCQYLNPTLCMADMVSGSSDTHKDIQPAEILKGERSVAKAMEAIENFSSPFEVPDRNKLYRLSSGVPVPLNVENDVLEAEKTGNTEKEKFIKERLVKMRISSTKSKSSNWKQCPTKTRK